MWHYFCFPFGFEVESRSSFSFRVCQQCTSKYPSNPPVSLLAGYSPIPSFLDNVTTLVRSSSLYFSLFSSSFKSVLWNLYSASLLIFSVLVQFVCIQSIRSFPNLYLPFFFPIVFSSGSFRIYVVPFPCSWVGFLIFYSPSGIRAMQLRPKFVIHLSSVSFFFIALLYDVFSFLMAFLVFFFLCLPRKGGGVRYSNRFWVLSNENASWLDRLTQTYWMQRTMNYVTHPSLSKPQSRRRVRFANGQHDWEWGTTSRKKLD